MSFGFGVDNVHVLCYTVDILQIQQKEIEVEENKGVVYLDRMKVVVEVRVGNKDYTSLMNTSPSHWLVLQDLGFEYKPDHMTYSDDDYIYRTVYMTKQCKNAEEIMEAVYDVVNMTIAEPVRTAVTALEIYQKKL